MEQVRKRNVLEAVPYTLVLHRRKLLSVHYFVCLLTAQLRKHSKYTCIRVGRKKKQVHGLARPSSIRGIFAIG